MTALEHEYRYMIGRTSSSSEKKKLVHHAFKFDLDLSDLLEPHTS